MENQFLVKIKKKKPTKNVNQGKHAHKNFLLVVSHKSNIQNLTPQNWSDYFLCMNLMYCFANTLAK